MPSPFNLASEKIMNAIAIAARNVRTRVSHAQSFSEMNYDAKNSWEAKASQEFKSTNRWIMREGGRLLYQEAIPARKIIASSYDDAKKQLISMGYERDIAEAAAGSADTRVEEFRAAESGDWERQEAAYQGGSGSARFCWEVCRLGPAVYKLEGEGEREIGDAIMRRKMNLIDKIENMILIF